MNKKTLISILIVVLLVNVFSIVAFCAGSKDELAKNTRQLGDWLRENLFGTIGLIGVLIAGALVIFGNTGGLRQIGLVLLVLCIVAAYDDIWDAITSFFGS